LSSGAGVAAPTVAPPSGESMDATARAWLVMRTGEEVTATCKKRAVVESSCHRLCPVTHRAPFYQEGEHTGQTYLSQQ